ncbi:MAG: hypothetical protein HY876_08775 [Coriobacteriales bacterium]|nr:hypothetical protein [Coriobacteriales bacterium]
MGDRDSEDMGIPEGRPGTPVPDDDEDRLERCVTDRESLTPSETSDCAGMEIAEEFQNEEDGGS